ncbi:MAG: hypothetical protein GY803_30145 [Chloroflexi bacterium]|nr:hypothetical protein [Chloroflexota bacterium]
MKDPIEIVIIAAAVIVGIALIVNAAISFERKYSRVYIGRFRRRLVVFPGKAGDFIAILRALWGASCLTAVILYFLNAIDYGWVFIVMFLPLLISRIITNLAGMID